MSKGPIVLVASVSIVSNGRLLIIEEKKPYAEGLWNFPSGRLEQGENILDAAKREVKEETGLDVSLTSFTGVYNFTSHTNDQVIMFHFMGEITGGSLQLEKGIVTASYWINLSDFLRMDIQMLRNGAVLKQIGQNIADEKFYPLSIIQAPL
ncbi:NUDIX domain-containing protein [Paenibacillus sp. Marseille-Q4541]|uniref:NUDIX hydrolase n=1 Tax=Paenibacillus sp. Marseille-Q4541 TaxID=2831522 RepID=UPI001BADFB60|nr:NUDIX domain-containing protein [Paenibacillus sp. Marseille-Q4541]